VGKLETGEHLDPTAEITLESVKERAVRGVVLLTGRTFILQVISLLAAGLLTVFLSPSDFGIFFIVSAVVNFLAYFSDVGLAAALIQSKNKITNDDLKTTFTVQQTIVVTLLIMLIIATPYLQEYYKFSDEGRFLLYALGASLLMSSLKTIPSVLLERELDFSRLVIPQVLENIVYNVVAVYFAWQGYGVNSFSYAVLARGVVGLAAMYLLKFWLPGIALSKKSLKKLLAYGVPYQANTLLATIKDDGLTAVLGGILGTSGIGYLGWAQKWAKTPLRLFMDNVLKVTFPAYSRMQDDKKDLARSVTRSIFFVAFLTFPSLIGFLIIAPMLTHIIPRYEKWIPALIPLYIIGIDTMFASVTTQLTNLLNAIGKITVTFKLMIMWTVLSWLLIPFLSVKYGFIGAAAGYALVSSSSIIAIYVAKIYVNFSLKSSVLMPFVSTFIMGVILLTIRHFMAASIRNVVILGFVGFIIYTALMRVLVGDSIVVDVKKFSKNIYSRS
jgi:O-antigen/teichoic acid export membrane protein